MTNQPSMAAAIMQLLCCQPCRQVQSAAICLTVKQVGSRQRHVHVINAQAHQHFDLRFCSHVSSKDEGHNGLLDAPLMSLSPLSASVDWHGSRCIAGFGTSSILLAFETSLGSDVMVSQYFIDFAALGACAHLDPVQFAAWKAPHLKHGMLPAQLSSNNTQDGCPCAILMLKQRL